MRNAQNTMTD